MTESLASSVPEPAPEAVSVNKLRDNMSPYAKGICWHVQIVLITRSKRGAPYKPAYVLSTELHRAIIEALPDEAPTATDEMKVRELRGRFTKAVLLEAWQNGVHIRLAADRGVSYDVTFVPSWWMSRLPQDVVESCQERIRSTRPDVG